jgi:hypothetical protein
MPTKVVIKSLHSSPKQSPTQRRPDQGQGHDEDDQVLAVIRRPLSFTSSLLRDINASSGVGRPHQMPAAFDSDIAGSPRLLGYVFSLLAHVVMLASVAIFNQNVRIAKTTRTPVLLDFTGAVIQTEIESANGGRVYDPRSYDVAVFKWKLIGAFVVAGFGVIAYLTIILAHFDRWLLPTFWTRFFRSGSHGERNMLVVLLITGAISLYINTSVLSVGEEEPNVYFTTWISVTVTVLTYSIWRDSANKPTIFDLLTCTLTSHRKIPQEKWAMLAFTTLVACLSVVDLYANRDFVVTVQGGVPQEVPHNEWIKTLCVVTGALSACVVALIGNNRFTEPLEMTLCGPYKLTLDWRQVEGTLAIGVLGTFLYVYFATSGVAWNRQTLGNAYFSSWLSFLLSANGEQLHACDSVSHPSVISRSFSSSKIKQFLGFGSSTTHTF